MATGDQRSDDRRVISGVGAEITILAGEDDTDGAWSLFEYAAEPGFRGPPPHYHEETVEGFYVLDGELRFTIDGEERVTDPNEYVHVPTRTVHTFEAGDEPVRFLVQVSPGGFEGYFERLGELMAGEERWPPEDMTPVLELMAEYDTHAPPVE